MLEYSSIIFAFVGAFLFGLTAVILKVGTQNQNLYLSLVIRASISVPILIVINIYRNGVNFYSPFTDRSLLFLVILSSVGLMLGDILLMHILKKKPIGMITPIIAINPVFTILLLWASGEETITFKIGLLSLLIIIGVFLVTYNGSEKMELNQPIVDFEALIYGLLISIVWGSMLFFDILILKDDDVDGFTFSGVKIIILYIISIVLLIISKLRNASDINLSNKKSIKFMLLAGITGWILGIILVYSAFDMGPPAIITPIVGLNPLFAVIVSVFLKFEGVNKIKILGIVLCISSSILLVL